MKNYLSLLLLLLVGLNLSGQNILQYNLKKDSVFTIKQDAQQVITQELDGASHILTNDINGLLEFTVVNEVDDNYELSMVFKDLNLKMSSSLQGELMNIKAKEVIEGDIQSSIFNSLLNSPIHIVLAKTGDILEVIGGDSLVTKMTKASGLTDEFSINMMKKSLEKEFGSSALSNNYKQMTFIYPSKKVAVGDSWENEYFGKLNAKNKWTLQEIDKKNTTINGEATVIMSIKEPATTMNLTGNQKTNIITNTANGFLAKMTVEGISKGISIMTQMSDQEIPTTIKSIITYELIK